MLYLTSRAFALTAGVLTVALLANSASAQMFRFVSDAPLDPAYDAALEASLLDDNGLAPIADVEADKKGYCARPCCRRACGCCGVSPCARWTVSAGPLFMYRENPDNGILFSNQLDPSENMNANDFEFGWQTGFELGLIKRNILKQYVCGLDLEARFAMVDGWSDTQYLSTTAVDPNPPGTVTLIHTDPLTGIQGPRDITSRYSSELTSFEVNLRKRSTHLPRWTWLAGFRYLELDEDLDTDFADPNGVLDTNIFDVKTRNRLAGFQSGAEVDLISTCCFCLRGIGKAGIYNNRSTNGSRLACNESECGFTTYEETNEAAFVGETGLSAKYCVCKNLAIRGDYRVLWVDGAALASNQFKDIERFDGNGINTSGTALYHGVFVGAEYTW